MSLDCAEMSACADLLHEAAEHAMAEALRGGSHQLSYVGEMRRVAALEEAAALVEAKLADDCEGVDPVA